MRGNLARAAVRGSSAKNRTVRSTEPAPRFAAGAASDKLRLMEDRDRFDSIKTWPDVLDLLGEQESVHLECKKKADASTATLDQSDKVNLGTAISGFANVSGGLLIFGLKTKQEGSNESFTIKAIAPIENVRAFHDRVEAHIQGIVDPPIARLDVKSIADADGSGVVLVHVPASDGGPHRAVGGSPLSNDRYYMRTVSSTVVMPHALLAALFGRTATPRLRFKLVRANVRYVQVLVENNGRGYARTVQARFRMRDGTNTEIEARNFDLNDMWLRSYLANYEGIDREKQYLNVCYMKPPHIFYPDDLHVLGKIELLQSTPSIRFTGRIDAEGHASAFFDTVVDVAEGAGPVLVPAIGDW